MNEQVAGTIRHILTAAGGALVTDGTITDGELQTIVGGIVAAFGLAWSLYVKKNTKRVPDPPAPEPPAE